MNNNEVKIVECKKNEDNKRFDVTINLSLEYLSLINLLLSIDEQYNSQKRLCLKSSSMWQSDYFEWQKELRDKLIKQIETLFGVTINSESLSMEVVLANKQD